MNFDKKSYIWDKKGFFKIRRVLPNVFTIFDQFEKKNFFGRSKVARSLASMYKVLKWGIFNIQKGKYGRERGVAGKKIFSESG